MTFFSQALGLFNDTFNAIMTNDFFSVLVGVLVVQTGFALFVFVARGSRALSRGW